jgi:toxin ParE1/3/4
MQVRWVRKALRNLEQAHAYIAKDNPEAAMRAVLKIQVAVDQLGQFPLMGRVGRVEGTRELVIANTSYFVIYGLKDNTVEILRVLHTSRRYPN